MQCQWAWHLWDTALAVEGNDGLASAVQQAFAAAAAAAAVAGKSAAAAPAAAADH